MAKKIQFVVYFILLLFITNCTATCSEYLDSDLNKDCNVDFKDFLILAANWLKDDLPQYPHGLSVNAIGTLQKDGVHFQGFGVNFADAFWRTLINGNDTSYDEMFNALADYNIPCARILGCGYWAVENYLYLNDKDEYFRRFDGVVESAEEHGIGLIPSLFWAYWTVPDIVGEPCNRWGDPNSQTIAFMRAYVQDVVTRYNDSPAIWGWECGNEWHLHADLPNAADNRPPVAPWLGTPPFRTEQDDLTHEMLVFALSEFAREIRKYDPDRIISSGNSTPRPSAWHQWKYLTWDQDTPAQHAEMLQRQNPDPIDVISIHHYEFTYDIAYAMSVAQSARKPLFVGEYGVSEDPNKTPQQVEQEFNDMLATLENEKVPLSAVWVFDLDIQEGTFNITPTNSRSYQLDAVSQAND